MFKGLISRVFRSVSVRPGPVSHLPGAAETHSPATEPAPRKQTPWRKTSPRGSKQSEIAGDRAPWAKITLRDSKQLEVAGGAPHQQTQLQSNGSDIVQPLGLFQNLSTAMRLLEGVEEVAERKISLRQQLDVTAHIQVLRQFTGYTFKDQDLVKGAIFKTGKLFKGMTLKRDVQLHLALIGDKLLEINSLSANFETGGRETKWHRLASNAALHFCLQRENLPRMLAECGHASRIQGEGDKGFGTMAEAIIGAIYEDSGQNGAVTQAATDRLLGTTMDHKEVGKFIDQHKASMTRPKPQLYWLDLVQAELKAHRQRQVGASGDGLPAFRPGQEDLVMKSVRLWAKSVRTMSRRRPGVRGLMRLRSSGTAVKVENPRLSVEPKRNSRVERRHARTQRRIAHKEAKLLEHQT